MALKISKCRHCGKTLENKFRPKKYCNASCRSGFYQSVRNPNRPTIGAVIERELKTEINAIDVREQISPKLDKISFPRIVPPSGSLQVRMDNPVVKTLGLKVGDLIKITVEVQFRQ